jgi:carbon storage regulator CsrA
MLVLGRRQNEAITIDGPAVITVVRIEGSKVVLGIKADPSVRVDRGEVAARIAEQTRIAVACLPTPEPS